MDATRYRTTMLGLMILGVLALAGCGTNQSAAPITTSIGGTKPPAAKPAATAPSAAAPAGRPRLTSANPAQPAAPATSRRDTVAIASFNIQVFGTSKLKKSAVMNVLAQVVRRFDVVAIQEVRSTDETILPSFVQLINAPGLRYDFVIGPRLGRTSSKEQYAIVFNTDTIEVDRATMYTVSDPGDRLHREPLVAHFRVRTGARDAFTFKLVDIHTDPDETVGELDALADVFTAVQRDGSGEDDVILLGDLNVDEYHLGRLGQLPGIAHVVTRTTTNTRRDKMYDNIVFNRQATSEFTGRWGVLDLEAEYGLSREQALEVSDHLPVWAEFSVHEGYPGPVATLPAGVSR